MKKHFLKALLICLGVTLLCGLYSFKTPDDVKLQQDYRTIAICYDTIITSDDEESECIKTVVESVMDECECTLRVMEGGISWGLFLNISCDCKVIVTFSYTIYYINGDPVTNQVEKMLGFGDHDLNIGGSMSDSRCNPGTITARLAPNN